MSAIASAELAIALAFQTARDWARNGGNQSSGGGPLKPPEPTDWSGIETLVKTANLDMQMVSEMKELEAETLQLSMGSDELINQVATEMVAAIVNLIQASSIDFPPVMPCVVSVLGPPISPIYAGGGITTFVGALDILNIGIAAVWNVHGFGVTIGPAPAVTGLALHPKVRS